MQRKASLSSKRKTAILRVLVLMPVTLVFLYFGYIKYQSPHFSPQASLSWICHLTTKSLDSESRFPYTDIYTLQMIIIVTVPPYQISVILISSFCINILCLLCPIVKNKQTYKKSNLICSKNIIPMNGMVKKKDKFGPRVSLPK